MITSKHIQLLQKFIACKSITPKDDGAMKLIGNYLSELGFQNIFKTFGSGDDVVVNLYSTRGKNKKNLCFLGHVDVVPPGDEKIWTHDPFDEILDNNIIYGRGAVDMKGAVVCFIAATEAYMEKNHDNCPSFLLTGDEEGVAEHGIVRMAEWLINEKKYNFEHCIVGEPVSRNEVGDTIKIGARGSATFIIKIKGKQGHVAYNHLADNPVKKANPIITDLLNYEFLMSSQLFAKTNLEITKITCDSGAENMIPNEIIIQLNVRYGDNYTNNSLKDLFEEIIRKNINSNEYEMVSWSSGDAFIGVKELENNKFIEIIKIALPKNVEVSTYGGTSDARFMKKYCDVAEVGLIGETAHKVNENVSIDDLNKLTQIYFNIMQNYFR